MRKRAVILLASACALAPAATPALADESAGGEDLGGESAARPAGERLERAYVRWRHKLRRHDVWHGRDLVQVAHRQERPPSARELSHSIHRMQRRFHSFLRTPRGRAVLFARKVRRIPDWGRSYLSSIAACESRGNPRAVGGGGAFRGLYQFTFGTWRVVGGYGDPAAAPVSEQTWRAWLLLTRHGSAHWPVCG
jgi:hypothetical protein